MKEYTLYKDCDIPWLSSLPTHWVTKRAKYLFSLLDRPVEPHYEVITCFRDGVVTLRKNRRQTGFTESLTETGYQGIKAGDLVIHQMDAFAGSVGVSDSDGKSTPVYSICSPKEELSPYYYAYIIREMARTNYILSLAKGIRQRSTDFRYPTFARCLLPVPPVEEQNAIVSYLDKKCAEIDELVTRRQAIIERLKELKQSIIAEAVTKGLNPDVPMKDSGVTWMPEFPAHWTISKIKNKAKVSPRVDTSHINFGDLVTFTPMEYIKQGYYIPNHMPYEAKYNSYTAYAEGDIVIAKVTPCFENGNICIMNNLSSHIGFGSSELIVIRPNNILPAFLMYALRNPHFIAEGKKTMYGTGGLKRISPRFIPNCNIAVPPEKEQHTIVAYLDKKCAVIDELVARQEQIIEKLKELKTSTIAHVVTGKVDVRDAI